METEKEKDIRNAKELAYGLVAMAITILSLWALLWLVAWMK